METEERKAEMRKAYDSGSHKKLWIVIAVAAIVIIAAYFLMPFEQSKPVDITTDITVEDVTYPTSVPQEYSELYEQVAATERVSLIKSETSYDWPALVENPVDSRSYKLAAILYLQSQIGAASFEYLYLTRDMNISEQEFLALPVEKTDTNSTSKQIILSAISNVKIIEEFYKEKELPLADTNINRLNFLQAYFSAVDIPEDAVIYDSPEGKYTYREMILTGVAYGDFQNYVNMMIAIEIVEAKDNIIKIKNIGKEDIETDHIRLYIDNLGEVCQWAVSAIKPDETQNCNLAEPCTGKEVKITAASKREEITCS